MENNRRGRPRQNESIDVSWPMRRKWEAWLELGKDHPHEDWVSFYALLTNQHRLGDEDLANNVLARARACDECSPELEHAEIVVDENSPPDRPS
jgi:hypothetical protein